MNLNKKQTFTNGITMGCLVCQRDWYTGHKRYGVVLDAGITNGRREHVEVAFFSDTDPSGFSKEMVEALDCSVVKPSET